MPTREEVFVRHGDAAGREIASVPRSTLPLGRFGRLFPASPSFLPDPQLLTDLGKPRGQMQEGTRAPDNDAIPAGFTYFGQFVDHDITFDPVSNIARQNDPDSLHNFRTPRFDLDSVYGLGPGTTPHLYNRHDPDRLLTGRNDVGELDLPRNSQNIALIGDPRNDENILISQMHVAFLHFHNGIVEFLRKKKENRQQHMLPGESLFETAQRLVRWHYQWIVVHDFLPRIVGNQQVDSLLTVHGDGRHEIQLAFYNPTNNPFIPVEFAAAGYRFGHSMIRPDYQLNNEIFATIFGRPSADPLSHLGGSRQLPDFWQIRWPLFFKFPRQGTPQFSRMINAKLAQPLMNLPESVLGEKEHERHPERRSLAARNLLRGRALGLPSGQAAATEVGETPLTNQELGLRGTGWGGEAPLWFYVLAEANKAPQRGKRLGPVGGRIVAETLLGLLEHDRHSFVKAQTPWKPRRPIAPEAGTFTFPDLVRFADVVEGSASPGD
jgi:hypothetical protein